MNIGYARVSTARQGESLDIQHFFSGTVLGSKWQRPGLKKAFSYMRPGGT